ncbi:tetratricopeptide repeat protein [Acidobacteriota bacterium]
MNQTDRLPQRSFTRVDLAVFFTLCMTCVLVYTKSPNSEFVMDDMVINENPYLASPTQIAELFRSDYWGPEVNSGLYRPLPLSTLSLQRFLNGQNAQPYHIFNLVLHAGVCILAYLLSRSLTLTRAGAFIASMLFALHPIHVEAVGNITGRSELMASLFSLMVLLLFRCSNLRPAGTAMTALFFLFALLSKESAVLVLPIMIFMARGLSSPRQFLKTLMRLWPCGVSLALYLTMRYGALGSLFGTTGQTNFSSNPIASLEPLESLASALAVFSRSVGLIILPLNLSVDYSFAHIKPVGPGNILAILGIVLLVSLVLLALLGRRRMPVSAFCAGFFVLSTLLTSNLFFPIGTAMAERLLYFPSLAFCIAFGSLMSLPGSRVFRTACWGLTAIALVWFSFKTIDRNRIWMSNETFAESAVRSAPSSLAARQMLALARQHRGRYKEALHELSEIERIVQESDPRFHRLLYADPRVYRSRNMRGTMLMQLGDLEGAQSAFESAVAGYPDYVEGLINLGNVRTALNKPREALFPLNHALWLKPDSASALNNAALALLAIGSPQEIDLAEKTARRAVVLRPDSSAVHDTLGDVLVARGNLTGAREEYENALSLAPTDVEKQAIQEKILSLDQ